MLKSEERKNALWKHEIDADEHWNEPLFTEKKETKKKINRKETEEASKNRTFSLRSFPSHFQILSRIVRTTRSEDQLPRLFSSSP